jgi:hypothetical protein
MSVIDLDDILKNIDYSEDYDRWDDDDEAETLDPDESDDSEYGDLVDEFLN